MRVLVACEVSGRVRDAFRLRGHDAYSCDILPVHSQQDYHIQGDIRDVLEDCSNWDLLIAHPPCTALAVSGNRYYAGSDAREEALLLITQLMWAPIKMKCIENPVGVISSRIRKPDQIIQPYEFGDDASKRTCLWLEELPPLPVSAVARVPGRKVMYNGKIVERWSNQTDSGQNRLGPSDQRAALRAVTYKGIADAMAATWG